MSNGVTVQLSKTYKLAGKDADSITFREPKVADLITIETVAPNGGQHAVSTLLMAQLSGATQSELAEFSLPDYAACDRAMRPFTQVAERGGDA